MLWQGWHWYSALSFIVLSPSHIVPFLAMTERRKDGNTNGTRHQDQKRAMEADIQTFRNLQRIVRNERGRRRQNVKENGPKLSNSCRSPESSWRWLSSAMKIRCKSCNKVMAILRTWIPCFGIEFLRLKRSCSRRVSHKSLSFHVVIHTH